MAFKLVLVAALCVAAASGYVHRNVKVAPALRTLVAPRAVSAYSSGITHAVALQERTVVQPLAIRSNLGPAYAYGAPAIPANTALHAAPIYRSQANNAALYAAPFYAPKLYSAGPYASSYPSLYAAPYASAYTAPYGSHGLVKAAIY